MVRKTLRNKSFRRKSLKRSKTLKRNKSFRRKSLKRKTHKRKNLKRKNLKKMSGGRPSQTCNMDNFGAAAGDANYGSPSKISNGNVTLVVTVDGTTYYNIVINFYTDETKTDVSGPPLKKSISVSKLKSLVKGFISDIKENSKATMQSRHTLSFLDIHLKDLTKIYKTGMGVKNCADRVQQIANVCQWLENLYINCQNYLFNDNTVITKPELMDRMKRALSGVAAMP